MRGYLQIGDDGPRVTLPSRGVMILGRSADCDLTVDDKLVSRHHCHVEVDGEFFWLVDLGSKAGTVLNGARVQKALLYDGDEMVLGTTRVTFLADDDEPARPPVPMDAATHDEQTLVPEVAPEGLVGQTFAGCEIVRRFDKDGAGYVFEARQVSIDRTVAVKVLVPPAGADPDAQKQAIDRFMRGVRSAGKLNHTNVVTVFDAGIERGLAYVVMEYVDQASLKDVLNYRRKKRSPLPTYTTLTFGIHVCRALEHAHAKRVVHRNIKPANILIDSSNVAKLTGFGLARPLDEGASLGTVLAIESEDVRNYMAPELLRGEETDYRCDIFSLGAVLYHMAANQEPFAAESPVAVMERVLEGALSWPHDADVPESVRGICEQALCANREGRFADAGQLKDALHAARKEIRVGATDGDQESGNDDEG